MNSKADNRYNNDENLNSSLSSSNGMMENQGKQLENAREQMKNGPEQENTLPKGMPEPNRVNPVHLPNQNVRPTGSGLANQSSGLQKSDQELGKERGVALKNKVASAGLHALGVPKSISDKLASSKKSMNPLNPKSSLAGGEKGSEKSEKGEAEKTSFEKDEEEEKKERRTGGVTLRVPLKVKLIIFLAVLPTFTFIIFFFAIILSFVADQNAMTIFFGRLTGNELLYDLNEEFGKGDSELGMGGKTPTYDEYLNRYQNLGNVYEYFKCNTAEECKERNEVKFYIKVNDITLRYRNKYSVRLDWELLMSTALSLGLDATDVFKLFLSDYDGDDVEKYDELMDLDWDYDYKDIPGYNYLSPKDYRYDLQILAKNMVTKTTTQTCTKKVMQNGVLVPTITNTKTDTDVEDQYFKVGQPNRLTCAQGEVYDISSDYVYDEAKFDEFLLEYLEHKLYLEPTGIDSSTGETDMTPSEATGEYIFPLPSGATSCRSSAYGYRFHPINKEYHYHSGDDYPAAAGTSVYAVADGKVIAAGYHNSMGNYVKIQHDGGIVSVYMHASQLFVQNGDNVKQGDVIMAVGTTGSSTGNHLHITFYKNNELDDPKNYIGSLGMCN